MSPREFLNPRYKVIEPWPFMKHFKVGEIVTLKLLQTGEAIYHYNETHQNYDTSFFDTYPHLFKRLRWFEDRELSSLPEYLKGLRAVKRVVQYEYHTEEYPSVLFENDKIWCPAWMYEPATKEEYEIFINRNK